MSMGSSWITSGNVSGEKFTPEMIQERRMRPIFGNYILELVLQLIEWQVELIF